MGFDMRLRKLLLCLGFLPLSAVSHAHCETTVTASSDNGYVDANYLRGYRQIDSEGSCYDPYEVITLRVNMAPDDNGLAGMTYVAGADNSGGGALLTSDGDWEEYQGGLHSPTERYQSLPPSATYTIFDSRGDFNAQQPWLQRRASGTERPPGPATMCELIRSFGARLVHFGAGYGAIQPDRLAMIERFENNPHVEYDGDHVRGAFAYSDGLRNEKYGAALTFNCSCSDIPTPYSQYGSSCSEN